MTATTAVRWRPGESRLARTFPALDADHPAVTETCLICGRLLGSGISVSLLVTDNADTQARQSTWYAADAVIVHTACAADLGDDLGAFATEIIPRRLLAADCEHDVLITTTPSGCWVAICKHCVTRWNPESETVPEPIRRALRWSGIVL